MRYMNDSPFKLVLHSGLPGAPKDEAITVEIQETDEIAGFLEAIRSCDYQWTELDGKAVAFMPRMTVTFVFKDGVAEEVGYVGEGEFWILTPEYLGKLSSNKLAELFESRLRMTQSDS